MAKGTRICGICGKEYPYCKTFRKEAIFRWQDVACCQEHGAQYFAEVFAARAKQETPVEEDPVSATQSNDATIDNTHENTNAFQYDDAFLSDDEEDEDDDFDDYWYEEEFEE